MQLPLARLNFTSLAADGEFAADVCAQFL